MDKIICRELTEDDIAQGLEEGWLEPLEDGTYRVAEWMIEDEPRPISLTGREPIRGIPQFPHIIAFNDGGGYILPDDDDD
jgi:hypothetical protein